MQHATDLRKDIKVKGRWQSATVTHHWYIPVHLTPDPSHPVKQVQSKLPILFVQLASLAQLSIPNAHSSISSQHCPLCPAYPELKQRDHHY